MDETAEIKQKKEEEEGKHVWLVPVNSNKYYVTHNIK